MKKLLTVIFLALSVSVIGQTYSKDLEKSAKNGDVAAQRDLGICYLYGNGKKADFNKAYEWLMRAAVQNDGVAQFHLGIMCESGSIGEVKKYNMFTSSRASAATYIEIGGKGSTDGNYAALIYELATKNGSKDAPRKLYEYYIKNGMPNRAMQWLRVAAESGDKNSQFEYGKLLAEGKLQSLDPSANYANILENLIKELREGYQKGDVSKEELDQLFSEEGFKSLFSNIESWGSSEEIAKFRTIFLNSKSKILDGSATSIDANSPLIEAKSWFEKAAAQGHEEAKVYLQRITQELDAMAQKAEQERIASQRAARELNTRLKQYRNIKLEKPNSILSALPMDLLPSIDSLTIVGFMYETDLKVLEDCKNLRYLDLSRTYITYSPQKQKEIQAEGQLLKSLFVFMGEAADAKYNDYEMSTLDHAYVKGFAKLMADGVITKADEGCIIPSRSMCNMAKLETLILPTRAYKIGEHSFKNCTALKNVKLPPYLTVIGSGCFYGCASLSTIDFPKTLTTIGSGHTEGVLEGEGSFMATGLKKFDFSKCTFRSNYGRNMWYLKLFKCQPEEICLPSGVERVHLYARMNKTPMTIYVPASVKMIDAEIIVPSTVHFASPTPPRYDTYKFESNSTFYVPKGSTTAYYSAFGNSYKYIEE